MGTKENPGAFDCHEKAEPDEPIFTLLGRDRHAPEIVRAWAGLAEAFGEDADKVEEARSCADAMQAYRQRRQQQRQAERGPE